MVFEDVSAEAVRGSSEAQTRKRIALDAAQDDEITFDAICSSAMRAMPSRASAPTPGR